MSGSSVTYIVGPTAVGKSRVALAVAERVGGAIVSADSMQVYRGMDIGTAKPSREDIERVPHYLVDIREPWETFSVAEFQRLAARAVADAVQRGLHPLIVGGTGLYVRALLDEYEFPRSERAPELRDKLDCRADQEGLPALHRLLMELDPVAAARIHEHDRRRLVRALEHCLGTGQPLSASWGRGTARESERTVFGLTMPRPELYSAIDRRVDLMIQQGLLNEVGRLMANGSVIGSTAMQAVGYKELLEVVMGRADIDEAVRMIKRNTRRLVRRQYTWFRRYQGIRWLDVGGGRGQSAVDMICLGISDIVRDAE